jgi:penicillin-binding protein 1B
MQLNIGRVMSLAARAGIPKPEKAYPSMALGTAEATPLNVATAYTMFANLGDRVLPTPITQITQGDGRVVATAQPDRKQVVRPEVAYIMDDIMKDVINRGTAASAGAWGFHNVAGKTAFAGKTGTSRDGWFAGFTPEIVCVVYVGFDNGDDLDMKGADSALPIWADFMQAALRLHPDWNGDWAMPGSVRRAEIDTRDGLLIRELDQTESLNIRDDQNKTDRKPGPQNGNDPNQQSDPAQPETQADTSSVPTEFRRVELFVGGTVPTPKMVAVEEPQYDPDTGELIEKPTPTPKPTPVNGTWQDGVEPPEPEVSPGNTNRPQSSTVSVMICPLTGMRATSNCPDRERRTFRRGTEPKEFCTFHVNPPK